MSSQAPYTNAQGEVFTSQTSGVPLATQAYTTASDTTLKNSIFERLSVTATASGSGTGTITPTDSTVRELYVTVISSNAAHIVVLPQYADTNYPRKVTFFVTSNGFELVTAIPAAIGINGAIGASSTVPANSLVTCTRVSSTGISAWICMRQALSDGAVTAIEAANG